MQFSSLEMSLFHIHYPHTSKQISFPTAVLRHYLISLWVKNLQNKHYASRIWLGLKLNKKIIQIVKSSFRQFCNVWKLTMACSVSVTFGKLSTSSYPLASLLRVSSSVLLFWHHSRSFFIQSPISSECCSKTFNKIKKQKAYYWDSCLPVSCRLNFQILFFVYQH